MKSAYFGVNDVYKWNFEMFKIVHKGIKQTWKFRKYTSEWLWEL